MSNILYPISLIAQVDVTRFVRVEGDQFEDGSTATRKLWADKYQKRRFAVKHSRLTVEELRYLRDFWNQRDGLYDSFWFRANSHRGGNASVRFTAPLQEPRNAAVFDELTVQLDEVAPIRALPEIGEVVVAAGNNPLVWYDANKEIYYEHLGLGYRETSVYDAAYQLAPLPVQAGILPLAGYYSQYQFYLPDGTFWAKSTANLAALSGSQPAATWFVIGKHAAAPAATQDWLATGTPGSNQIMGLVQKTDGSLYISSNADATGSLLVGAVSTSYKSFAAGWPVSSNAASVWLNAAAGTGGTVTRSYTAGPVSMAADSSGANKCSNASGVQIAHALLFNALLTTAQVKALHNLFAHQYGMALVP